MSLPARLESFLEDLAFFPDRADRIQLLISQAEKFKPIQGVQPPFEEGHKVPACESEAYAWAFKEGDGIRFEYAVLNPQGVSAMAMAVILKTCLDGESPEAIAAVPDDLPLTIFGRELSMGKSAGLMGMVQLTKALAQRPQVLA
jgi:cysteine desulfuration protein SufE